MLDLAKIQVQATLGMLSRYSGLRVDPYTALVGEVMCQNFQYRNIETAVNTLKVVGCLSNMLDFGFGIEDIVRSMAKSERGRVCPGLCTSMK